MPRTVPGRANPEREAISMNVRPKNFPRTMTYARRTPMTAPMTAATKLTRMLL